MTAERPSAFVLAGPTASGKSAVVQRIARQTGAAVVSADSMNVYRGMDVGTAKPSPAERAAVPYFGLDLAEPVDSFSAGDWLRAVRPAFQGGPPPVVAGGTGLYVKCLLEGLDNLPSADEELRRRTESMTLDELQAEARKAAPEAFAALADPRNPRRLVRLIEHGGRVSGGQGRSRPAVIGLLWEREALHRRIAARVEKMYADGLLEEARGLLARPLSATARHAIGYAEAFAVLRGECSEAEARKKTVIRTRQLAKRQMTWFRNQFRMLWVDAAAFPDEEALAAEVLKLFEKHGAVPANGV